MVERPRVRTLHEANIYLASKVVVPGLAVCVPSNGVKRTAGVIRDKTLRAIITLNNYGMLPPWPLNDIV